MLCEVKFVLSDGSRQTFNESTDLDYWNIRQWRLLYFKLCELQKVDKWCRLEIIPINPFDESSKLL